MRLLFNRIPLLYIYLSSLPSSSSAFSRPLQLPTKSSFQNRSSSSSRLLSSSSNNIGLSEIGQTDQKNKNMATATPTPTTTTKNISSWRDKIEISIAKSRKVRGGNYVQIATVDPSTLEPRCRTVVFRGFLKPDPNNRNDGQSQLPLSCVMKMITDKRSNKFQEVTNTDTTTTTSNTAELVWWFSKSSEQYRVRGQLKFVGDPNDDDDGETDKYLLQCRKEQWGNLSDMAREQFYWVDPGLKFDNSEEKIPPGGRDEDGKVLPPPSNFLLMLLYPTKCDYLRLKDNFRQVDDVIDEEEDGESGWDTIRVNP